MPQDDEVSSFADALTDATSGGERGLTELFRAFHPRLLRYLRAREPGRAEDIAGETWIAVANGIRDFDGDAGAFAGWLFTIARFRLADHRRTAARRRTDPVADVPERPDTSASAAPNETLVLEQMSAQAAVDLVVRHLSEDQADVVLMRVLGGLTPARIAEVLGRDENWVRVTHHRAVHRLRERLPEDF